MDVVGLIPAGGTGSRLGRLPCSKEVLPLIDRDGNVRVISENLIRYYKLAGINEICFIIRKGKWDIPEYFGDGSDFGVNISYLIMNAPFGTPYTLNQAYPFIKDKLVAVGFPDIIFEPTDAYQRLLTKFEKNQAEIILGVVPYKNYSSADMLEFDQYENIRDILIKENRPDLKYSWFIAVWRPGFSRLMKDYIDRRLSGNDHLVKNRDGSFREVYFGDVIIEAIRQGLKTDYIIFEEGYYKDLGTREMLKDYQ